MSKAKRLWALLLTLAMVLTYMPAMAFANGDDEGYDEGSDEVSISLDTDYMVDTPFFSDGKYSVEAYPDFGNGNPDDYEIKYSVGVGDVADDEFDSETGYPYKEKLNSGWSAFEDGYGLNLNGAKLWEAAESSSIDSEDGVSYTLVYMVEILDKDSKERIAYDYDRHPLEIARIDAEYGGGDVIYAYIDERDPLFGGGIIHRGYEYGIDGRREDASITDIKLKDSSYAVIEHDFDGWTIIGKKRGKTEATLTIEDDGGNIYHVEVDVVVNALCVGFTNESNTSNYLPGAEDILTANTESDRGFPEDAKFVWNVSYDEYIDSEAKVNVTITPDTTEKHKAKMKVGNLPEGTESSSFYVELKVYDSNDELLGECSTEYSVRDELYVINLEGANENLDAGESCDVTCILMKKTTANPEGVEVSENVSYEYQTDGDVSVEEGGAYNKFTITRTGNGNGYVTFTAIEKVARVDDEGEEDIYERADASLWFDYRDYWIDFGDVDSYALFDDTDYTLSIDCGDYGDSCSVNYSLLLDPKGEDSFDEERDDYVELTNTDTETYYTEGENALTLHVNPIFEAAKDYPGASLHVKAVLKRGDKELASNVKPFMLRKAEINYFPNRERLNPLCYGHGINEQTRGFICNSENPDGEWFDFEVTNVVKTDESDNSFDVRLHDMDGEKVWFIESKRAGIVKVDVTHTTCEDPNETVTETVEYEFAEEVAEFDEIVRTDGKDSDEVLPTQKIPLSVNASLIKSVWNKQYQYYEEKIITSGLSFKWVFTDTETASNDYAVIDNSNTLKPTIRIKSDISEKDLEKGPGVQVKVAMYYGGRFIGEEIYDREFSVVKQSYVIEPETMNEYLKPNVKTKYDPSVVKYEFVNGAIKKTVVSKKVNFEYDTEEFKITDASGKSISNDSDGPMVQGPFYVTRLTNSWCNFTVQSRDPSDEMEYSAYAGYQFRELTKITKWRVTGIKNKVYNGKAQTQAPTIVVETEDGDTFRLGKNEYSLSYKNNKSVGKASVVITANGRLSGSVTKTFNINPKGTSLKKVTKGKKSFTVTWKKQATQTTGYQIQYGLKKNFKGAKTYPVKKNKTVKATIKKLKAKKTYYVRIRTYKTVGKTKYYSGWSSLKKIKTK